MVWFLIWFVLSGILIAATVWSQLILIRQKKAWEAFARRRNFTYRKGTFMGPPEMSGMIGDYRVSFYTAERQTADMRTKKYVSVVELELSEGLIDGGVAGTQEMLAFMQSLTKVHPYPVKQEGWDPAHHIFVKNDAAANAYFTPERLEVFSSLLKTRNADVLIVFTDTELVVRMETSDPIQDDAKIDKILDRQIALTSKMRITPQQREQYMALAHP